MLGVLKSCSTRPRALASFATTALNNDVCLWFLFLVRHFLRSISLREMYIYPCHYRWSNSHSDDTCMIVYLRLFLRISSVSSHVRYTHRLFPKRLCLLTLPFLLTTNCTPKHMHPQLACDDLAECLFLYYRAAASRHRQAFLTNSVMLRYSSIPLCSVVPRTAAHVQPLPL